MLSESLSPEEAQRSANHLIARGYRRISNKYRTISRIDRPDWLTCLARNTGRSRAEFYIEGDRKMSGTVSATWCDWYRRCLSKDTIKSVLPEVFKLIPSSDGDNTGYCP